MRAVFSSIAVVSMCVAIWGIGGSRKAPATLPANEVRDDPHSSSLVAPSAVYDRAIAEPPPALGISNEGHAHGTLSSDERKMLGVGEVWATIDKLRAPLDRSDRRRLTYSPDGAEFSCVITHRVHQSDTTIPTYEPTLSIVKFGTAESLFSIDARVSGPPVERRGSSDINWGTADIFIRTPFHVEFGDTIRVDTDAEILVRIAQKEVLRQRIVIEPAILGLNSVRVIREPPGSCTFTVPVNLLRARTVRVKIWDRDGVETPLTSLRIRGHGRVLNPLVADDWNWEQEKLEFEIFYPGIVSISKIATEFELPSGKVLQTERELDDSGFMR